MSTRLVTLLWLFAVALLGLSGDYGAHEAISTRDVAIATHHATSILQAHDPAPGGDVSTNDTVQPGHFSLQGRTAPGISKRWALVNEDSTLPRAVHAFPPVPALAATAGPPLIHNQARAPPA
jgi:hypothetical protein